MGRPKEQIPGSRDGGPSNSFQQRKRARGGDDSDLFGSLCFLGATVYIILFVPRFTASAFGRCGPVNQVDYTRFEKARIVGARALQLSMGAPPLIEMPPEVRNPVQVAMAEYDVDAIPLTVQRSKTYQVKA